MNGQRATNGALHHGIRPLTVDEALQYSPFSSIVPYSSEIIPLPNISLPGSTSLFASTEERKACRQSLEALNQEAYTSNGQSGLVGQTVRELQKLLNPSELTQFKFKQPPKASDSEQLLPTPTSTNGDSTPSPQLGSFANMLFNTVDIAYRYPSPVTPGSQFAKSQPSPKLKSNKAPATPVKVKPSTINQNAFDQNARISIMDGAVSSTPKGTSTPAVIIPKLPPSVQHDEYKAFPDIDRRKEVYISPTKKRKLNHTANGEELYAKGPDQLEKSDAALRSLQELISSIFEAEDQLQPDTSGAGSANAAKFFSNAYAGDNEVPVLTTDIQTKLDASMQKVVTLNRFHNLPLEHLIRLQKLCENALKSAEAVNLKLEDGHSEDDVEHWLQHIGVAESGLRSSRTLLRILTAGRAEKQIYSEEILYTTLNMHTNILENCIIPVVECRNSGRSSEQFKTISHHKKAILTLVHLATRGLRMLSELIAQQELAESAITTIEFLASKLVFVENAHTEKESILGIQKYEGLRLAAMDIITKVFLTYTDQRTFIIDEILSSLEKLPVTKQSARQFKLGDGKSIQLVSALIMRLVQTSGTRPHERNSSGGPRTVPSLHEFTSNSHEPLEDIGSGYATRAFQGSQNEGCIKEAEIDPVLAVEQLTTIVHPLYNQMQRSAQHVTKFLVQRALTSTKTGDQPYRNLLDIFTEDFITVLNSPDWPAAEILLRVLLQSMVGIAEGDKSAAPAKNVALDLMGSMGSAISDLIVTVRQAAKGANDESELSGYLAQLADETLEGKLPAKELLALEGPYRVVMEQLRQQGLADPQISSAYGYFATQWARGLCAIFDASDNEHDIDEPELSDGHLASELKQVILTSATLESDNDFDHVSSSHGRLAYAVAQLNMPFCRAFDRILDILLKSMNSEQATVRSKSLKSVVQLLEKDPTILNRGVNVMLYVRKCASDTSPLVRDSAISLIGKCLALKPALENEVLRPLLTCANDSTIGVRKRSMKLLKDIYLDTPKKDLKTIIADALLQRVRDPDESVSDLAKQMFEEIWIMPYHGSTEQSDQSVQSKLALKEQVSLIVKTVQKGGSAASTLDFLLQNILSNASKNATSNFRVCTAMVAAMFEGVIDSQELPGQPGQQQILQTLTLFARANPKLFKATQLESLQHYVDNINKSDDIFVYRSVIVIFRCVLPHLPSLQRNFLEEIQKSLFSNISKLGKNELNEVVSCLWTINGVLKNTKQLANLTISCVRGAYQARNADLSSDTQATRVRLNKWMTIAALFGKHCDFDSQHSLFRDAFPWWKGSSVAALLVDVIAHFTSPKQPADVRRVALDSIGTISRSWPKNFLMEQVHSAYDLVFKEENSDLQNIVLTAFKEFFSLEEARSEKSADVVGAESVDAESGRLGVALAANENDGVSTSIAQRFLKHIIRIALATQDKYALTATEVIGSVNRQGLVHPKECGPALVALETSRNTAIASIAFREHRTLHQKHETMFEKEYMKAVHQAFIYQKDIVGDASGATTPPYTSKLRPLFEIMKTSNAKLRKKFLSNLCSRIDFDPAKLDVSTLLPAHLQYSRFIVENLAFLDYGKTEDLLHVISCMEKVVVGTGTSVAHAIEVAGISVTSEGLDGEATQAPAQSISIDQIKLRQLTSGAMILSMLWESRSFLRRAYGLAVNQKQRDSKGKVALKDLNKAPVKVSGVNTDKFWEQIKRTMTSLDSFELMVTQCKSFVEILSVDSEFKLAAEADEDPATDGKLATPSDEEEGATPAPPGGNSRGRKRSRQSLSETPGGRKKKNRPSVGRGKRGSVDEDGEWE
ncbi:MAG: Sister chromatid cohesion protein 2 [Candelina submexicana]|nr:MAG: Sister chromatid cohesion protein 2 [Candelina submexicana]